MVFKTSMYIAIFVCMYDFKSYRHTLLLNKKKLYVCNEKKNYTYLIKSYVHTNLLNFLVTDLTYIFIKNHCDLFIYLRKRKVQML